MYKCHSIIFTTVLALGCEVDEDRGLSIEVAYEQSAPKEQPSGEQAALVNKSESPGVASDAEDPMASESTDLLVTAEHPDLDRPDEIGDVTEVSEVTCACKTCNWASCCNMPLGSCGCTIYMWTVTPPRTCYDDRPLICLCD